MSTNLTASRQQIAQAVKSMSYSELKNVLRKFGTTEGLDRPIWELRRELCLLLFRLRSKALRKQRQATVNIEGTDVPVIGEFHGCPVVETTIDEIDDIYSKYHPLNKKQDKIASITILVQRYLRSKITY